MTERPQGLPPELYGLWDVQYAPRDLLLKAVYSEDSEHWKSYNQLSYTGKIALIDRMQELGFFDRLNQGRKPL